VTHTAPKAALATLGLGVPDPGAAIECASSLGIRAVSLDAAARGLRPRELSRSQRRGIAAALRRSGLDLAGLDLFIPPEHLVDPAHTSRAIGALESALTMSAEIAALLRSWAALRVRW